MTGRFPRLRQILDRIHDDLVLRWNWYRRWHEHPRRHIHHGQIALGAGLAGLITVAVSTIKYLVLLGIITSLALSPQPALAASQTWTTQSDWGGWTLSNTTAADNPGSVQLSTTEGEASWADDTSAPSESYLTVFATDASNVWYGITDQNYLEYYNGASYSQQGTLGTPSGKALWGSAANDVWAFSGAVLTGVFHYNGSSWSSVTTLGEDVNDASGVSSGDIWAAAANGTLYHYNGSSWSESSPSPKPGAAFKAVFGFASNDFWAAGDTGIIRHWTGASWGSITSPSFGAISGIWGASSNDLWIRANDGNLYHTANAGSSWTTDTAPATNSCTTSSNLWGTSTSDIWTACKSGAVLHYNGSAWSTVSTPAGTVTKLYGTSATNIWGVAGTNIFHYSGATIYQSSGTANITYTPSAGQINDWTTATPSTTTPANTTATLEYSHNGSAWVSSLGSVPSSESLYVRATLATTDTAVTPSLDALTVSYDAITATVVTPAAGGTVHFNETGDTTPVTWTATGTDGVDHIHLQYSTNSGSSWTDISGATALTAATVTYDWNMPDTSSSTVRIKVILEDASNATLASDTTNSDFTLNYDTAGPDFTSVTATSNNAHNTVARSGDIVTATFTASETLSGNPTVTIGGQAMTYASNVGLNYTYTRTITGIETEGLAAIAISGTDEVGNSGSGSGSFSLDFTNPAINVTSPTTDSTYTTGSSSIVIAGNSSDNISVFSVASSVAGAVTGTTTWSQTVTLAAGANAIVYTVTDTAGHTSTDSITVTYDPSLPTFSSIASVSNGSDTTIATTGNVVTVTFTASEALIANPTVTLGTRAMTYASNVGLNYTYTRTITGTETEGSAAIEITGTDLASNTGTGSSVFVLDFSNPTISIVSPSSSGTYSTNDASVDVSGSASDSVTLSSVTSSAAGTVTGTTTWSQTVAVSEGSNIITYTATDRVGHTATASITISSDTTAPVLTATAASNNANTSQAKVGDIITVTISSNENLTAAPTVTIGALSTTCTGSGQSFSCTRTVTSSDTEGALTVNVSGTDVNGNTGTTTAGPITIDRTTPTVTATAASNNANTALAKTSDIITVTVNSNENLAASPTVTIGALSTTCTGSNQSFSCTRTVTSSDTEGSLTVSVSGSDAAGNAGTTTAGPITIDHTAPTITATVVSNNANTALAKTSDVVTVTISSNENLTAAPTVTIGALSTTCTGSNQSFSCTRTITSSDTEGALTVNVSGTDATGNTGTATAGPITIDRTAPTISVTSPATTGSYSTTSSNVTVSGTGSDSVGVATVTSTASGTVSGTTSWQQTVSLSIGVVTVTYTATDTVGNTGTASIQLTRTAAPDVPATEVPPVVTPTPEAPAAPDPVTNLTAYASQTQVTLTYIGLSSGHQALIWRSTASGERGSKLIETTSSSYVDTTVSIGMTYHYTVIVRRDSDQKESAPATANATISTVGAWSVSLTPEAVSVQPGGSVKMTARVLDVNGNAQSVPITWSVKDGIGTIDSTGRFTASSTVGDYRQAISASVNYQGKSGSASSDVFIDSVASRLSHMYLSPRNLTMKPAEKFTFQIAAFNQNGTPVTLDRNRLTWSARGGSIDQSGAFTAGSQTGSFEQAITATYVDSSGQTWVSYANVTISTETPRLNFVTLTSSRRIPLGLQARYYAYPYDQFWNVIIPKDKSQNVFSNNNPDSGTFDATGLFYANRQVGCFFWNLRVDRTIGGVSAHARSGVITLPYTDEETQKLNENYYFGFRQYRWTHKPNANYSFSGWFVDGWGRSKPHTATIFRMLDNRAGSITPTGQFVAGPTEGIFPRALGVYRLDTNTNVESLYGKYSLVINQEDPRPNYLSTNSATAIPYSVGNTQINIFDQFGVRYTSPAVRNLSLLGTNARVLQNGQVETGAPELSRYVIIGQVNGALQTSAGAQGYVYTNVKNAPSCTAASFGPRPGDYDFDDDGEAIYYPGPGDIVQPGSPVDKALGQPPTDTENPATGTTPPLSITGHTTPSSIWQRSAPWLQRILAPLSAIALIASLPALGFGLLNLISNLFGRIASWLAGLLQAITAYRRPRAYGRVLNRRTKQPVVGATVQLLSPDTRRVIDVQRTDLNGQYIFLVDSRQTNLLVVTADGFQPFECRVRGESLHRLIRLGLALENDTVAINHRLVWQKLFRLLAASRTTLLVIGTAAWEATILQFPSPLYFYLGFYYLLAWLLEWYISRLPRPFGTVTDAETGQPLDRVIVRVINRRQKMIGTEITDQKGRFRTLLTAGVYTFTYSRAGYQSASHFGAILPKTVRSFRVDARLSPNRLP